MGNVEIEKNSVMLGDYFADMVADKLGINFHGGLDPSVALGMVAGNYDIEALKETFLDKTDKYGIDEDESLDSFEELRVRYGL